MDYKHVLNYRWYIIRLIVYNFFNNSPILVLSEVVISSKVLILINGLKFNKILSFCQVHYLNYSLYKEIYHPMYLQ